MGRGTNAPWQSYEFVLAPNGVVAPEDLSPSLLKLAPVSDGFIINNITGIRTKIVQRMDGKGYDVRKGGFPVTFLRLYWPLTLIYEKWGTMLCGQDT